MPEEPSLNPDEILVAEYTYIAQNIFQANEDRSRVASFYMVSFGTFVAALVTYQFNSASQQQDWVRWGFGGLFLALAMMGLLTVFQLARLRQAWFEGLEAMNHIKEYYIARIDGLDQAFVWRRARAPHKFKPNSVGFLLVVQVAALGGVSLGAAVFLISLAVTGSGWLLPACAVGLAFCLIQLGIYRNLLKK